MDTPELGPEASDSLIKMLLGFFGFTALFLLLPKTIKYMIRRFVIGIFGEIVAVVVTGLLTEKVVEMMAHDDQPEPNGRGPAPGPRF